MDDKVIATNNDIVFYKKDNGDTNIELLINGETLWVTQKTMAEDGQIMTMKDWINETDSLLKFRKKEILKDSGRILHKQAIDKAHNEYENIGLNKMKNIFQVWMICIKNI